MAIPNAKAAETAKRYDSALSKKLVNEVEQYRASDYTSKEEMVYFYNRVSDTFALMYSENKSVNVFQGLKYLLNEIGIRKE